MNIESLLSVFAWGLFPVSLFYLYSKKGELLSHAHSQMIKGVAIIVIILHHISQLIIPAHSMKPFQNFGFLGVSIFLFLSGYGLSVSASKNGISGFFNRRISRVWIPFFVLSIVWGVLFLISQKSIDYTDVFLRMLGIKVLSGSYWYVYAIGYLYFGFFVSHKFSQKFRLPVLLGITLIYWVVCFNIDAGKWWYTSSFCFLLGVSYHVYQGTINGYYRRVILIACIVAVGVSLVFSYSGMPLIASISKTITSSAFSLVCLAIFSLLTRRSKFYEGVGKYSYEAYLSHVLVLQFVVRGSVTVLSLSLFVICTILMSLLLKWTCETYYSLNKSKTNLDVK